MEKIKKENRYISGRHAYNIEQSQEDGDVVINDPYNPQFLYPVPKNFFLTPKKYVVYKPIVKMTMEKMEIKKKSLAKVNFY